MLWEKHEETVSWERESLLRSLQDAEKVRRDGIEERRRLRLEIRERREEVTGTWGALDTPMNPIWVNARVLRAETGEEVGILQKLGPNMRSTNREEKDGVKADASLDIAEVKRIADTLRAARNRFENFCFNYDD